MKKLLYAAIVAFLFIGGLAAGVVHKEMQNQKVAAGDPAAVPTEATGLSLADLGASTPTESLQNSETLNLTESSPTESPTAVAAAPTPEDTLATDAGRSFGGGGNTDPVRAGSGSSASSSAVSSWSDPAPAATKKSRGSSSSSASSSDFGSSESIPSNTDYGSTGTIIEDPIEPVATPRKGKGSKSVAVAAPTPDVLDEMPTVDDSGDPFATADSSSGGGDPFASTGSAASMPPATPDPFAASTPPPLVAMNMPSGGGDLVFGAASNKGAPALKKVAQKQNGASSVVMIELAGSARYKIIQIPKKRQVWIDFEGTEVPGGGSSVSGSAAHVREISAKFFANESGGSSIARIIVQLDDGVVQMNEKGKEELAVTPNRGTGEASKLTLTIGAKSQQF